MDKFVLNLIHRPEMVPEYSATVTGQGKEEDIGDKALLTESLDIFKRQQRLAHENGLKVTIQMTYASLFNDEAVEIAKHDHEVYGDEIALSLLGLPCEEFREPPFNDRSHQTIRGIADPLIPDDNVAHGCICL